MGIIAKQSIRGSVYTYIGVVIAFVNVGLLMPKFFKTEEVGLLSILIAVTLIFSQIGTLGFSSIITRLFPYFRNYEKKHNGILLLGMLISAIGFIIILTAFYFLKDYIIELNKEKSVLFVQNIFYLPFLIFFTIYFFLFDNYSKVLFDAAIGIFMRELMPRILNLFLIVLYIVKAIDFDEFILGYVISFISPALFLFIILIKRKTFYLSGLNKQLIKKLMPEILKIGGFGIIAGFSGIAVINIDKYMVNHYLGLSSAGIYSIAFYFGTLIVIPARAIKKISSIVIAESWKSDDLKTISDVYYKSTVNQLILGLFLFMGIWANIDNIFMVIPDYVSGRYVILFIAFANVIDMLSGVSATVIASSSKYKVFSYIMIITLINIVILNVIFIPVWGLTGAAFASLIAIFITAFLKFLYLKKKFNLQPYKFIHFKIFLTAVITLIVNYFVPVFENFYIDIFIRSTIITTVFGLLIYYGKASTDINKIVDAFIIKIRQIL